MALRSPILAGSPRLEQAASGGPVIKPAPPHDDRDAVGRIQKALAALSFSMPITFPNGTSGEPDGKYGQETYQTVIAFQKRAFPNDAHEWDGRVGPKTLAKLDEALLAGGGTGPTPGPAPIQGFAGEVVLIAIHDNPLKGDLNASDPPVPPLKTLEAIAVALVNGKLTLELKAMMVAELTLMAQGLGIEMFNKFVANGRAGAPIVFGPTHDLSVRVAATAGFASVHTAVAAEFERLIQGQHAAGGVDVRALAVNRTEPASGGRRKESNAAGLTTEPIVRFTVSEPALLAVIGLQVQGGIVSVSDFIFETQSNRYAAKLKYQLLDHFGVDNDDVVFDGFHGTPGQVAFWVLQHRRHPGHNPYVTTVIIEREVTGPLVP